ncbi:hypothetical protein KIPB_009334, partial [Kipferlia bialata]
PLSLTIVDFDTIEPSNMNRHLFLRDVDVGQSKAKCLERRVKALFPEVTVRGLDKDIMSLPLSFFRDFDIVYSTVDTVEARLHISDALYSLHQLCRVAVPLIDTAVVGLSGNVRIYAPSLTPCMRCNLELFTQSEDRVIEPLCTLAGRPRTTTHCILYARERVKDFDIRKPKHMAEVCSIAKEHAQKHQIAAPQDWNTEAERVLATGTPSLSCTGGVISSVAVRAGRDTLRRLRAEAKEIQIPKDHRELLPAFYMFVGDQGEHARWLPLAPDPLCTVCQTEGTTIYTAMPRVPQTDVSESMGKFLGRLSACINSESKCESPIVPERLTVYGISLDSDKHTLLYTRSPKALRAQCVEKFDTQKAETRVRILDSFDLLRVLVSPGEAAVVNLT